VFTIRNGCSRLISRGRSCQTLTFQAGVVTAKHLSLVHEARHLCGDLSKSDHFPTLPYDESTIVTPLRTDLGLAVDVAESAALLRSPSDLTPEAARSAGFPREVWSRCNDNGNVFVKVLLR
jgi:hypothetical protein